MHYKNRMRNLIHSDIWSGARVGDNSRRILSRNPMNVSCLNAPFLHFHGEAYRNNILLKIRHSQLTRLCRILLPAKVIRPRCRQIQHTNRVSKAGFWSYRKLKKASFSIIFPAWFYIQADFTNKACASLTSCYIIKGTVNGHYYHYMGNSFAIF